MDQRGSVLVRRSRNNLVELFWSNLVHRVFILSPYST